jgi:hypothetical protein
VTTPTTNKGVVGRTLRESIITGVAHEKILGEINADIETFRMLIDAMNGAA